MNIQIKDAIDKALIVCSSIEQKRHNGIREALAADIASFIRMISLKNGEERLDYFRKLYLQELLLPVESVSFGPEGVPKSLIICCNEDNESVTVNTRCAKVLAAFFCELGRYYMFSSHDRKEIDTARITSTVRLMSEYITNHNSEYKQQTQSDDMDNEMVCQVQQQMEKKDSDSSDCGIQEEQEESLEELLEKLDSLIGLSGVKNEVSQIINLINVQKKGEEFGAKLPPLSLHLVFYGNPGTGKTTVARLLSKIYKCLGVLSQGQIVEVDRSGLVAGYVGQTATKTQEVIDKAMGGILFIDEAYALTHGKGETDFGQEAVDTILKAMEDHRDDFIVIVAGYPDLMKEFIASNPGLKSRFNQYIDFEDYTPKELIDIFKYQCRQQNLQLTDECDDFLMTYFEEMYNCRSADYANGRDVRNFFEKAIRARANRLASILDNVTYEEYMTFYLEDLQEAAKNKSTFK